MEEHSEAAAGDPAGPGPVEFTFVLDETQEGVRSHAMREYWRRRRRRSRSRERREAIPHRPRQLLPRRHDQSQSQSSSSRSESDISIPTSSSGLRIDDQTSSSLEHVRSPRHHEHRRSRYQHNAINDPEAAHWSIEEDPVVVAGGIPTQVLTGVNHALACSRLDPFDMFPVILTAQHHKLLHHWLSTHATMMFAQLPTATFNPMRDVWFPLDLSNAASFNAIMAHAAAHLARLQGVENSHEAIHYKAEAMRIVRVWMDDPTRALSDEVFAAVIRLLTFERYFGTEAEWRVHRDGLQRMIEARGGIETLRSNWRLELVTYLISLMAKPSWFESSNNISELSEEPLSASMHPLGDLENLRRVRRLWLISFIQDINTFLINSPEIRTNGLRKYPTILDAILLLQAAMKRQMMLEQHSSQERNNCNPPEFARLGCLFFISVLIQASAARVHHPAADTTTTIPSSSSSYTPPDDDLGVMNTFLASRNIRAGGTVDDLHTALFNYFHELPDSTRKRDYALQMTNVLASLSSEARRGVERCLLRILCGVRGDGNGFLVGENWTPDALLSTLHGL